jgi:hypothetical protein
LTVYVACRSNVAAYEVVIAVDNEVDIRRFILLGSNIIVLKGEGTDHIRCDFSICHKSKFNVDNIVSKLATIEEACRTRVVVGQDIG